MQNKKKNQEVARNILVSTNVPDTNCVRKLKFNYSNILLIILIQISLRNVIVTIIIMNNAVI